MQTSESLKEIGAALAKAQGAMTGAKKDAKNPHFKSDYATLASVIDAAREALAINGLSVVQGVSSADKSLIVTTRLLHASGEWIEDSLAIPLGKFDAQGVGSATTYGRRYALAAMVGIAQVDDDGNTAVTNRQQMPDEPETMTPRLKGVLEALREAAINGTDALKAKWKALPELDRERLSGELDSLKKAAAECDAPVAA